MSEERGDQFSSVRESLEGDLDPNERGGGRRRRSGGVGGGGGRGLTLLLGISGPVVLRIVEVEIRVGGRTNRGRSSFPVSRRHKTDSTKVETTHHQPAVPSSTRVTVWEEGGEGTYTVRTAHTHRWPS